MFQMHKVPSQGVERLLSLLPPKSPISGGNLSKNRPNVGENGSVSSSVNATTTLVNVFACWSSDCSAKFSTLPALQEHYKSVHGSFKLVTNSNELIRCQTCGRMFRFPVVYISLPCSGFRHVLFSSGQHNLSTSTLTSVIQ